jgi:hypothetical protein
MAVFTCATHAPRVLIYSEKYARKGGRRIPTATRPGLKKLNLVQTEKLFIPRSSSDEDVELAVFRFTLGIPGFDDSLIPRVVGVLVAGVLLLNHLSSSGTAGQPQVVTEALGMILAAIGVTAPTLQKVIEESTPGKGRKAPVQNLGGSVNVSDISTDLSEELRQEAAWSSFALIKNANVCGTYIVINEKPVVWRGSLGEEVCCRESLDESLEECSKFGNIESSIYLDTRQKIESSLFRGCRLIPSGAGSIAYVPVAPIDEENGSIGFMLLICDREKAMSNKELLWCRSVASKLYHVFHQ